ncbi:hypothetical protein ACTXT7_008546 [Hymenolepis weldensis]
MQLFCQSCENTIKIIPKLPDFRLLSKEFELAFKVHDYESVSTRMSTINTCATWASKFGTLIGCAHAKIAQKISVQAQSTQQSRWVRERGKTTTGGLAHNHFSLAENHHILLPPNQALKSPLHFTPLPIPSPPPFQSPFVRLTTLIGWLRMPWLRQDSFSNIEYDLDDEIRKRSNRFIASRESRCIAINIAGD